LRRAVNREGGTLDEVLAAVPKVLRPGGRLVVLTYHSAEDRAVKVWIREHSEEEKREMGMAFGHPNLERWVKRLDEVVPAETFVHTPRFRHIASHGIAADDSQITEIERELTVTHGLALAAYQPRFLIEQMIASARFKAQPPVLTPDLVSLALDNLTVGRGGGGETGTLARVA
jgi:hypothetical protein